MQSLDLTLPTIAENLALDEALLRACDAGGPEVLRFWSPSSPAVVLGYANSIHTEANETACAADGVPILRRSSGGGAVVQMAGCLDYALVLRMDRDPALAGITSTNRFVLDRLCDALRPLAGAELAVEGHTDLALGTRKVSGNAQRRCQRALLFHGVFLLDADLDCLERWLPQPSRQPAWRNQRKHRDFVVNLGLEPAAVKAALAGAWCAQSPLPVWPEADTRRLVRDRYALEHWNRRSSSGQPVT
jgi:lipoate-protein ligase A